MQTLFIGYPQQPIGDKAKEIQTLFLSETVEHQRVQCCLQRRSFLDLVSSSFEGSGIEGSMWSVTPSGIGINSVYLTLHIVYLSIKTRVSLHNGAETDVMCISIQKENFGNEMRIGILNRMRIIVFCRGLICFQLGFVRQNNARRGSANRYSAEIVDVNFINLFVRSCVKEQRPSSLVHRQRAQQTCSERRQR